MSANEFMATGWHFRQPDLPGQEGMFCLAFNPGEDDNPFRNCGKFVLLISGTKTSGNFRTNKL
jgi:hypothetical protein